MLPLSERDKKLSQSPHFFKRWKERRSEIGYIHHYDFISEFYTAFANPERSLLIRDPRLTSLKLSERFCDTLCIFKNKLGIFVCVTLKSGDYYEMVNFMRARKWEIELFGKKEELRKQETNGEVK